MNDSIIQERPNPSGDGVTHINTHLKARTRLGRILAPSYNTGDQIQHPILGPFRTVENLWCYLNTGGNRDQIRSMEPHVARNFVKLMDKKYSCDKFKELLIDATILKLQSNSFYQNEMIDSVLPFDHYYLNGRDRVPIRPSFSTLYIGVLEECREILRGQREHQFVRFMEMNFRELP